jgi:hypothetical protein
MACACVDIRGRLTARIKPAHLTKPLVVVIIVFSPVSGFRPSAKLLVRRFTKNDAANWGTIAYVFQVLVYDEGRRAA